MVDHLHIRVAVPGDAAELQRVHRAAVFGSGAAFYPTEVLQGWAKPCTPESIAQHAKIIEQQEEQTFVAEWDGVVAGFSVLASPSNELRAVYVDSAYQGKGIGTALLEVLEAQAGKEQLQFLEMDASLNAQSFYEAHGYRIISFGTHTLSSGVVMDCVKMRKEFDKKVI